MAVDLTGIENRGEFYAHHYLDALLGKDLDPLLERWTAAEKATPPIQAPHKALNGIAQRYFLARAKAADLGALADEPRWRLAADLHAHLVQALGYHRTPVAVPLDDGTVIPLVHEVKRGGRPYLWIAEAGFTADEDDDPLEQFPLRAQLPATADPEAKLAEHTWRHLLDAGVFRQEEPPTWFLFLAGREVVLTHGHKWGQGKSLAFDLDDLYARRQPTAFRALAALLHADALCPDDGQCLHDTLDESSHKHAFGVSTDLREGAQEAIEILGNEVVDRLKAKKVRVFGTSADDGLDPAELTRECLTWLYRLIFLFYAESRSEELGVAPMRSDAYRKGYSLESLRALEAIPLTTPQAQEGTYLDTSLKRLFQLVNDGHPTGDATALGTPEGMSFRMFGLKSRLFDPERTPLISGVRLRNAAVQRILELLSLSREGRHKKRGRISYASLGINQLGAVYEGLLSYTGFFARQDLIEVCHAGDQGKADARTWFVPDSHRDRYEPDEIVHETDGTRRIHPRGTFLYRLAGRDREKSASYYTPEVLTKCLVKYTLKERLGEGEDALKADELLELTICEPAMGSGAFLNEVVNQLAEAYLQRKQAEVDEVIPADRYRHELQRVKARIAANQCYGVDLNPLAAELGKTSLWLNVLRPGAPAPFFDARILHGNSLVGARRAGYRTSLLIKGGKNKPNWLTTAPDDLPGDRPNDMIWHFLSPAAGMAAFDKDKVVKGLVPNEVAAIKAWRKTLNVSWTPAEVARLERLSGIVDDLFAQHGANRQEALTAIDQRYPVWPEKDVQGARRRDEEHLEAAWRRHVAGDGAGRRLKAAMDYWGALWFWPVLEAGSLPDRKAWLDDLEALLTTPEAAWSTTGDAQAERLRTAADVAARQGFVHWEHAFPEVSGAGGFDVIVGNPPWIKVQWNESGILSDLDPRLEIRRMSAKQTADERTATLQNESTLGAYLEEFEGLIGLKSVLNCDVSYSLLKGVQTNLYKAFLALAWSRQSPSAVSAMFHQAGIFDDPKGGGLRGAAYERLRFAALAKNQLKLFDGVHHERPFCFTIWGPAKQSPEFRYISNLFHPRTLDASLDHDGRGEVPAIKTPEGNWDLRGHRSRIVHVDEDTLALFAKLYDPPGTPAREARLPVVHAAEVLSALSKVDANSNPLRSREGTFYMAAEFLHESRRQYDGTIRRLTKRAEKTLEWIVSGPHFYLSTPLNKTPNEGCRHNQDYSVLDLMALNGEYLPRTNYVPHADRQTYRQRTPWWDGRPLLDSYKYVHRQMVAPTGERTLVPAIMPPGTAAIDSVFVVAFDQPADLLRFVAGNSSVPIDFIIKSTGRGSVRNSETLQLPLLPYSSELVARGLLLNCLTAHYADLWSELYTPDFRTDTFTKPDPRLPAWTHLGPEWTWETPLRTPYARRQALVELDALAALALGLTADELCLIYRIQFPVLQQYEADTWYDQRGRIVFTNNRGLNGVGLTRKQWDEIKGEASTPLRFEGEYDLPEWAVDALGPYEPPFDRCDREQDMRQAYEEFVRRGIEPAVPPADDEP